jgi:hypothetical protein
VFRQGFETNLGRYRCTNLLGIVCGIFWALLLRLPLGPTQPSFKKSRDLFAPELYEPEIVSGQTPTSSLSALSCVTGDDGGEVLGQADNWNSYHMFILSLTRLGVKY